MSIDSGMENKKATETQKTPDPKVAERQAASQRFLLSLLPEVRNKILEARSKSDLVKRSLEAGDWSALVRALRGIRQGSSDVSPYEKLVELLVTITPDELKVERKKPAAKPSAG